MENVTAGDGGLHAAPSPFAYITICTVSCTQASQGKLTVQRDEKWGKRPACRRDGAWGRWSMQGPKASTILSDSSDSSDSSDRTNQRQRRALSQPRVKP